MKRRKPLAGIVDDFKAKYDAAVAEYSAAADALGNAEAELWNVAPQANKSAEDAAAWQDEMNRIIAMQTTIETVNSSIRSIADFFADAGSFLGLSGFRAKNLGFALPAVPWATLAVITGGAAAIWVVIDGVIAFVNVMRRKAIDEANLERANQNLPPLPYPPDLRPGAGGGLTDIFGNTAAILKWLTIGGIVMLVLPELKRMKR